MTEELWRLPASTLAARYRAGTLSPVELAQACLARIDAVNPRLNAIIARRDAALLADARASRQRHAQGRPLSMLDGVPVSIKDNLLTTDLPTTWGTPALRDFRSPVEELAVQRLRAAGALLPGKTNVPEFTLEGVTLNPLHGVTRNPWAPALTPGGSSGGAAAAVAAGMGPLALGTDGGGSIRRPAAHCGLVGLKPGLGTVPRVHTLPPLLLDFEEVGPLARNVADLRLALEVLQSAPLPPWARRRLRILYAERIGPHPLDPQIAASVGAALAQFAALGHALTPAAFPLDLTAFDRFWPQVPAIALAGLFEQKPDWAAAASPRWRELAASGAELPRGRAQEITREVDALRAAADALFSTCDVLATPTTAALPWPVEERFPPRIAGLEAGPRGHAVYTGWVNAAGLPALSLPCRPSEEGLPIGLQLVGPRGSEALLLALGEAFEQLAPWAQRWPDC
ncbi:amidase [Ramlibacter sp. G-1-2-2]|uniref:Amidase n=1 Tax=Ramlibacter agri TaxID=2728837 RepID=A0A848HDJ3_9BURK|nr:amidase [Ramlibacter agri]NML48544.1 amidase [Ramlibacter agri]